MLTTLRNAFKVKDVRKKLLYTFIMLVIIRFGSNLPIPGVNTTYFKDFLQSKPVTHLDFSMQSPEAHLKV